jgi:prepilin-type N-terminal cleavage/methylation domain-containing protein/prepilin-type processing-associated H-X9-DG protein
MCKVRESQYRRGFTLVELLVVITIIGVLMGLLLPAVNGARRRARVAKCINHQRELASSVIQYDHAKSRLPGYVNQVHGTPVSWVPVLFPYLGRMELWETYSPTGTPPVVGWRMGVHDDNPIPYIEQLVCPDDVENSGPRLSYVVNAGVYTQRDARWDLTIPGNITPGVFRDYIGGTSNAISLSNVRSPSQTIMLGEYHANRYWNIVPSPPPPSIRLQAFGFVWPDTTVPALSEAQIGMNLPVIDDEPNVLYAPLQSVHPGIVIAAFCDGHVSEINNEALCREYRAQP